MNTPTLTVAAASTAEQLNLALLMLWAMALGAVVGVERERASKATGIRTHMLVAGAAALVAAVSSTLTADGVGDQSRGIHGVITGIGFLGAGAIIQTKKGGMVTGMTTAASIFYTAAIGCAVAVGYGITATIGTLLGVAILYGIGYISYRHPMPGSVRDKMLHSEDPTSTD
jgi:putative Mg2+ transporter-C (MgtC) family protein